MQHHSFFGNSYTRYADVQLLPNRIIATLEDTWTCNSSSMIFKERYAHVSSINGDKRYRVHILGVNHHAWRFMLMRGIKLPSEWRIMIQYGDLELSITNL